MLRVWLVMGIMTLAAALLIVSGSAWGLTPDFVGAFSGALVGGAAAMLGTLMMQHYSNAEERERAGKVRTLLTAELVNVAAGLIGAQKILRRAKQSTRFDAGLGSPDWPELRPRAMPYLANLSSDGLLLTARELDCLATLRSNLSLTEHDVLELANGLGTMGMVARARLGQANAHDLKNLAETFEAIAPTRAIKLENASPENAATLLRRLRDEGIAEEYDRL